MQLKQCLVQVVPLEKSHCRGDKGGILQSLLLHGEVVDVPAQHLFFEVEFKQEALELVFDVLLLQLLHLREVGAKLSLKSLILSFTYFAQFLRLILIEPVTLLS